MPNQTLSEKLAAQMSDPLGQINTISKHVDSLEMMGGGGMPLSYQYSNERYIDINDGSDSTGDGSFNNPWKTISYAESQITTATLVLPWTILIRGSGQYYDAGLVNLKPNINLMALSYGGLVIQSPIVINAIAGQDGVVICSNISFFDAFTYDGTASTTASLTFLDCYIPTLIWRADHTMNGYLTIQGGVGVYAATVKGYAYISGTLLYSPFTVEDGSPDVEITGCSMDGVDITITGQSTLYLHGNTKANSITSVSAGGHDPVIKFDSASMPDTITGTPTLNYDSVAAHEGYTPAVSGNWAGSAPVTVQQALDRMAALLKTLNANTPIP